AVADLRAELAHAEYALAMLEQEPKRDTAFAVHIAGLGFQVVYARAELELAEQFTGRTRDGKSAALDMMLPAGTIVACPVCGEESYRTTTRITATDLIHDDGTLLPPLNPTIPPHSPWAELSCPFCSGSLLTDSRLHTSNKAGDDSMNGEE